MANLKFTNSKGKSLLSVAAIVMCAMTAMGQNAADICRPGPHLDTENLSRKEGDDHRTQFNCARNQEIQTP